MSKNPAEALRKQWLTCAYGDSMWDVGNDWLYKLCKTYPTHTNAKEVAAKIWLIGRAYSAAAERGVSGAGQSDIYIQKLAQRFVHQCADKHLVSLPNDECKFGDYLDEVVKAHHTFEKIFSKKDELGRISLTSKYLHFHRPDLFPIYDSRAATAITKVTPDSRFVGHEPQAKHADMVYAKFCVRVAWLMEEMTRQSGRAPKLRQVDTMLLQIYKDTKK